MGSPVDTLLRALDDKSLVYLAARVCGLGVVQTVEGVRVLSANRPISEFEVTHDSDTVILIERYLDMPVRDDPTRAMGATPYPPHFKHSISLLEVLGGLPGLPRFLRVLSRLAQCVLGDNLFSGYEGGEIETTAHFVSSCVNIDAVLCGVHALLAEDALDVTKYERKGSQVLMHNFAKCILRSDSIIVHFTRDDGVLGRHVIRSPFERKVLLNIARMEFVGWSSFDRVLMWLYAEFTVRYPLQSMQSPDAPSSRKDIRLQWLRFQAYRRSLDTHLGDAPYPTPGTRQGLAGLDPSADAQSPSP
jgi:hypothetical protein